MNNDVILRLADLLNNSVERSACSVNNQFNLKLQPLERKLVKLENDVKQIGKEVSEIRKTVLKKGLNPESRRSIQEKIGTVIPIFYEQTNDNPGNILFLNWSNIPDEYRLRYLNSLGEDFLTKFEGINFDTRENAEQLLKELSTYYNRVRRNAEDYVNEDNYEETIKETDGVEILKMEKQSFKVQKITNRSDKKTSTTVGKFLQVNFKSLHAGTNIEEDEDDDKIMTEGNENKDESQNNRVNSYEHDFSILRNAVSADEEKDTRSRKRKRN